MAVESRECCLSRAMGSSCGEGNALVSARKGLAARGAAKAVSTFVHPRWLRGLWWASASRTLGPPGLLPAMRMMLPPSSFPWERAQRAPARAAAPSQCWERPNSLLACPQTFALLALPFPMHALHGRPCERLLLPPPRPSASEQVALQELC